MQVVYEASNNSEAYLIVHLLAQHDIEATVLGEHLQSAVGEIAAMGNIRVVVDASVETKAREIIRDWEAKQADDPVDSTTRGSKGGWSFLNGFVAGTLIAGGLTFWALNTPTGQFTTDYNRDGQPDEWLYYRDQFLHQSERDRNFDGQIDEVWNYTRRRSDDTMEEDMNFDGTFDTTHYMKNGLVFRTLIDSAGNGVPDIKWFYEHGVPTRVELLSLTTGKARKVMFFEPFGRMREAHWDASDDGTLDTVITFDEFGEPVSHQPLNPN